MIVMFLDAHNDNYYCRISWLFLGGCGYYKVFQLYAIAILHVLTLSTSQRLFNVSSTYLLML